MVVRFVCNIYLFYYHSFGSGLFGMGNRLVFVYCIDFSLCEKVVFN